MAFEYDIDAVKNNIKNAKERILQRELNEKNNRINGIKYINDNFLEDADKLIELFDEMRVNKIHPYGDFEGTKREWFAEKDLGMGFRRHYSKLHLEMMAEICVIKPYGSAIIRKGDKLLFGDYNGKPLRDMEYYVSTLQNDEDDNKREEIFNCERLVSAFTREFPNFRDNYVRYVVRVTGYNSWA